MFQKPFRVKSSVTVRNSDRRKIKNRITQFFPALSEDQVSQLIPAKGDLKENKIYTAKGEGLSVYTFNDEPTSVELASGTIIPYLYSLWSQFMKIPCLYVAPFLLEKFTRGADLMAPGIIVPFGTVVDANIQKHKGVAIKIIGQRHAVAIGIAEMCADDLNKPSPTGKAVRIISVIGDSLWASGSKTIPPEEADPELSGIMIEPNPEIPLTESVVPLDDAEETTNIITNNIEPLEDKMEENICNQPTIEEIRKEQDELLDYCFKAAVKTKLQPNKEKLLPILCSTFYSQLMLPSVPDGKILEIKKTSVKKLSAYLSNLVSEKVIKVEIAAKGVEKIATVDFKHVFFRGFEQVMPDEPEEKAKDLVEIMGSMSTKEKYAAPVITQLYAVSGQTKDVFSQVGISSSAVMNMKEMREHIAKYVEMNELRWRNKVKLDPQLHKCVFGKGKEEIEEVTWDKLYGGIQSKMNPAYSITFPGQSKPHIKKGKLPKLNITIKKVSGNKSVTLITGFEGFMIDENYFAELMKKRAQASTSIGPDLTGKYVQVQIQGNQTKHVQHIVTEIFKIEKKFINGLENIKGKKGK